ncbi:DUF2894 domain-containing protein [Aquabacterium sp. J223]|uniref:DUF2894 domain-containing protein n=1 Tax=Aquabacterium sp. J223 TaxID=2898431 RepID=UPI0021ADCC73|nr:DUF2894 domain-containing protein [Aquabacterium sp. J223]UUX96173.1 DUF2894 domain-containing protein [Aquabacterium sp. J223]
MADDPIPGGRSQRRLRQDVALAMARRAEALGGAALAAVQARQARWCAAPDPVPSGAGDGAPAAGARPPSPPSPLAALVQRLADAGMADRAPAPTVGAPPAELKALGHFRRQWARLDAERRLLQSAAALPAQAGPLHSHRLVHRALARLRELSPAYVERFMAHADALLWLEQAVGDGSAAGPDVVLDRPADPATSRRRSPVPRTTTAPRSGRR